MQHGQSENCAGRIAEVQVLVRDAQVMDQAYGSSHE